MKNVEAVYPLSPMQEGMVFHTLSEPDSGLYVNQLSWRFVAPLGGRGLKVGLFERAWRRVMDRTPVLRTSFLLEDLERPVQVVHRRVELPFRHEDWRGRDRAQRLDELRERDEAARRRGFELTRAPLFDLLLIRLTEEAYVFRLTFHHSIMDGWSVSLLMDDVLRAYQAEAQGAEPHLPSRRPFRDYVVWLQQHDEAAAERFWRDRLAGVRQPTSLVVDRRAPGGEADTSLETLPLDPVSSERLQSFARSHRLTPYTLLQGAWAVLLGRYSGEEEVVFGSVTLGRPAELRGADSMIGLFINTLPVRVKVRFDLLLRGWLRELQTAVLQAREFEFCSLRQIQEWSEVPRGEPLFESLLGFGNFRPSPTQGAGPGSATDRAGGPLPTLQRSQVEGQTNLPLELKGRMEGGSLVLSMRWRKRRFDRVTIQRMLRHVAHQLVQMPSAERLADLSLVPPAERHQISIEWNDSGSGTPSEPGGLAKRFEEQAARRPEAVAVAFGEGAITYAELDRRADRLARRLVGLGAGREEVVGVAAERFSWTPVAVLAAWKAGAAYLPLDPAQPPGRLRRIVEIARPAAVLVASEGRWSSDREGELGVDLQTIELGSEEEAAGRSGPDAGPPVGTVDPLSRAHVVFTSGSTGVPKGSMNTHRAVLNHSDGLRRRYGLGPGDRHLQRTPLTFDVSVWEIIGPLLAGATLVLQRPGASQDPALLVEEIERHRITFLNVVPSLLGPILDGAGSEDPLRSLRHVLSGGETLDAGLARRFSGRFRRLALHNHYGPTEATIDATAWSWIPDGPEPPPIGRPLPNVQVHLAGPGLEPVPVGVPGEVLIGGSCLARGYQEEPARTAESFVPDPFFGLDGRAGARLYRTGDLARRLPAGEIEFVGRRDHQVKLRGFRVELGEVEAVLLRHPAVEEAVVDLVGDGGRGVLAAYLVVSEPDRPVDPLREELTAHLREELPDYMVPSDLVVLESLPRLPNGKVDRGALPSPEEVGWKDRRIVAPRNDLERRLVEIWETTLNRRPVGVTDDFFQVGGHSLLAIRLMALIKKEFGQQLPLAVLLTGEATVERLAVLLRERSVSLEWSPLVTIREEGSNPPFFCVHPIGGQVLVFRNLAAHLSDDQPFFGLQAPPLEEADSMGIVSIEDMASHYLGSVREVQPEGPYLLGGMSFGGTVAFEMAQQLHRIDEDVGLVALFDTPAPRKHEGLVSEDYTEMIAAVSREYAHQMGSSISFDIEAIRGKDRNAQIAFVLDLLKKEGLASSEVTVPLMRRFIDGHQARLTAIFNYEPGVYSGRLSLFHAMRRHEEIVRDVSAEAQELYADTTLGWREHSDREVEVIQIPAYHETLLYEPQVRTVARELTRLIERTLDGRAEGTGLEAPTALVGSGKE